MRGNLLYDIGTIIYIVGTLGGLVFVVHYGFAAPWWRSAVGRMFMVIGLAIVLAGGSVIRQIVTASIIGAPLREYATYELVERLAGYSGYAVAMAFLLGTYLHERRKPYSILPIRRQPPPNFIERRQGWPGGNPNRGASMSFTPPEPASAQLTVTPSAFAQYAAVLIPAIITVVGGFQTVLDDPTNWSVLVAFSLLVLGTVGAYVAKLFPSASWAGKAKTGIQIATVVLTALVPFILPTGFDPAANTTLVIVAVLNALGTELGSRIRQSDLNLAA